MGAIFSAFAKPVVQVSVAAAPIPGMGAVADVLAVIVILCDTVPQNKCVALSLYSRRNSYLTVPQKCCSSLGSKMSTPL